MPIAPTTHTRRLARSSPRPPEDRQNARQRGYDTRWDRFRAWYRRRHPFCELCRKRGEYEPAMIGRRHKNVGTADHGRRCDGWRCNVIMVYALHATRSSDCEDTLITSSRSPAVGATKWRIYRLCVRRVIVLRRTERMGGGIRKVDGAE